MLSREPLADVLSHHPLTLVDAVTAKLYGYSSQKSTCDTGPNCRAADMPVTGVDDQLQTSH